MSPMPFYRKSKLIIVITRTQKIIEGSLHDELSVIIYDGTVHKSCQNGIQKKDTIKGCEEQKYSGVSAESLVGSIHHREKGYQCDDNNCRHSNQ